tara:strand:+ start:106 stop:381 length:276 start_codon:yes stop_codon:yes gene_type:complete
MKTKLESKSGSNPPACSRSFVLQYRFHDRQFQRWSDWTTIEGKTLREQYGTTVAEWKANCKRWIEMGGRYEYRIIRREETQTWGITFSENR